MKVRPARPLVLSLLLAVAILGVVLGWSHLINAMLPAGSRPAAMTFAVEAVDEAGFARTAAGLAADLPRQSLDHVALFRDAGILAYAGPRTCLQCHRQVTWTEPDGTTGSADLMENLTDSVHYRFFSTAHPNVYGFNGELADDFPMGKLNRPCPKPGSFAMTAWAELVVTQRGDTLSEGCGQCHIGGQSPGPPGRDDAPVPHPGGGEGRHRLPDLPRRRLRHEPQAGRVADPNGRQRWGQDRSLRAALSVGTPTAPRPACAAISTTSAGTSTSTRPAPRIHAQPDRHRAASGRGCCIRAPSGARPSRPAGTCTRPPAWPAWTATRRRGPPHRQGHPHHHHDGQRPARRSRSAASTATTSPMTTAPRPGRRPRTTTWSAWPARPATSPRCIRTTSPAATSP